MSEIRPESRRAPRSGTAAGDGADPHLPTRAQSYDSGLRVPSAANGYDGPYGGRVVVEPGRSGGGAAAEPEAPQMDVLAVLWRRRWVILGLALLGLAAGFVVYQRATPLYRSIAQIYVQQSGPRIMGDSGLNATSQNYLNTQAELIRSTPVLSVAVSRTDVAQTPSMKGVDNKIGLLSSMLSVTIGDGSEMIYVAVTAPYADDAALLANRVVEAYQDFSQRGKQTTAVKVLEILQSQKEKTERELEDLHAQKLKFSRTNGLLVYDTGNGRSGNIVTAKLAELSNALTDAQLQTVEAKLRSEMLEAAGTDEQAQRQVLQMIGAGGGAGGGGAGNADLWSQVRQLKLDLKTMQYKYGEDYPDVVALKRRIPLLEQEIGDLDASSLQSQLVGVKQQYQLAQLKERELQKAYDEQRKLALDVNATNAEFEKYDADIRAAEQFQASINDRIKQINVNEDAGGMNVTSIETARPNSVPVSPVQSKLLGTGLVGGLMVGLGLALLLDWADPRLRGVEEIGRMLDLPVLGVIPRIKGKLTAAERGLTVQHLPRGEAAEAYRNIRTVLFFELPAGPQVAPGANGNGNGNGNGTGHGPDEPRALGRKPRARTLVVTSPTPGDGKTTMAANLAIAMAQSGRRVLLLDADCRKPMVHRTFGVAGEAGLSTLIADDAEPSTAVVASEVANLDLLPCGPVPSNPSEMLNSDAFAGLMDELSGMYDMIVIDSPPVLPVADARILAASADATLLVLRANKSSRKAAQHARDSLARVGGNLLGVAVNDVEIKKRRFGGYGADAYHGYGYYAHGYHSEERAAPAAAAANGVPNGSTKGGRRAARALPPETDFEPADAADE